MQKGGYEGDRSQRYPEAYPPPQLQTGRYQGEPENPNPMPVSAGAAIVTGLPAFRLWTGLETRHHATFPGVRCIPASDRNRHSAAGFTYTLREIHSQFDPARASGQNCSIPANPFGATGPRS
jgi:hypothetical protein